MNSTPVSIAELARRAAAGKGGRTPSAEQRAVPESSTATFRRGAHDRPAGNTAGGGDSAGGDGRNDSYPWERFDSEGYLAHNYARLHEDDRQIIEKVREFFSRHPVTKRERWRLTGGAQLSGLDIGSGTNLYPAFAMLPYCRRITLMDYADTNVGWLRRNVPAYGANWDAFWESFAKNRHYRWLREPRRQLARRGEVRKGSIFELGQGEYDLGTMFFVAESISADHVEFQHAIGGFLRSLRPGAPFAAAFMENSLGYEVGGMPFPAVRITEEEVRIATKGLVEEPLTVHRFHAEGNPLRDGYTGMLLALGTTIATRVRPSAVDCSA